MSHSCRCRDFLGFIYQTIRTKLQGELANLWGEAHIEFIFSVPMTWKPGPTIERYRSIVRQAGFGSCPNHRAEIGLTEAEAAAMHTAREFPRLFKVLMYLPVYIQKLSNRLNRSAISCWFVIWVTERR
jgi:hypothetical protein